MLFTIAFFYCSFSFFQDNNSNERKKEKTDMKRHKTTKLRKRPQSWCKVLEKERVKERKLNNKKGAAAKGRLRSQMVEQKINSEV